MYMVDWTVPPVFSAVIVYPVASCSSSGEPEIVPDSDSERPVVRPGIICQEVISPPTVLGDIEMGWPSENVK